MGLGRGIVRVLGSVTDKIVTVPCTRGGCQGRLPCSCCHVALVVVLDAAVRGRDPCLEYDGSHGFDVVFLPNLTHSFSAVDFYLGYGFNGHCRGGAGRRGRGRIRA